MKLTHKGNRTGFPFVVREKSQDGKPVEIWDGNTYANSGPSKVADKVVDVIGGGTNNPFALSHGKLAEEYWRLKKYKVSTVGLTIKVGSNDDYNFTFTFPDQSISFYATPTGYGLKPDDLEDERRRVAVYNHRKFAFDESGNKDSISRLTASVVAVVNGVQSSYQAPIWFVMLALFDETAFSKDGKIYPFVQIAMTGEAVELCRSFSDEGSSRTNAVISFLGATAPIIIGGQTPFQSSGTLKIEPIEWLSYGGKWNTTTGAPIR